MKVKVRIFTFLSVFLMNQVSFALCEQPVTYLDVGERAVCAGYLFSPEKTKEITEMAQRYPIMVELISKQEYLINKLNERVELNQQISANLREQLQNKENENNLEKIIYFALGTAIGIGVSKIIK